MKIAMVSAHASPLTAADGQGAHLAELASAMAGAGHEVTVHTRRASRSVRSRVDTPAGYRVVHVPAGPPKRAPQDDLLPFTGEFSDFLRDHWVTEPPDLVHAHSWVSGIATALAAGELGIPFTQSFPTLGSAEQRHEHTTGCAERIRFERMLGRRAGRVIAGCAADVLELCRLGVPRDRIAVVPAGVDLDRFSARGPWAPRTAKHRIVSVGPLVPRTGFDVAIAALPQLPDAELVIAGGPEHGRTAHDTEARRLRQLAARLGVAERVRWPGRIPRAGLPALLRSADVVVCTPRYEPDGVVALQAMACAVPVVAAAVGGLSDAVVDGFTGLLVRPGQPDGVVTAIRRLLANPALRDTYGAAGQDRATARYSWDRIAADMIRAYPVTAPEDVPDAKPRSRAEAP
ncbi:glycosyltransferase [Amycolatopsis sp. WQ 127309]|uniref:glycosyltransferase n=1 Tax=Amycolatopsis sp. WQ 127309 TaxID=2932773 RepID=UPI001FF1DE73|nr:glycosyltransferase [Amycolatopsis sp. WQ 127309]UOZ04914.1 glycosyltransferase [Amycolatopsis sp. WQ 127309]